MRTNLAIALTAAVVLVVSGPVSGQVLISEIMYNPDSYEGGIGKDAPPNQTEWVELYNAGDEAVSLAGFYLQDEDGRTEALPESAAIEPSQAIVLIPGTQTVGDFRKAWGKGFDVYKLAGWAVGDDPLSNLANGPSSSNEVLTLRDKEGEVVDEVNYDDEGDWPKDSPDGPSIALNPDALDPEKNGTGKNWSRSEDGKHGAKHAKETDEYSKEDVGSPGVVEAKVGNGVASKDRAPGRLFPYEFYDSYRWSSEAFHPFYEGDRTIDGKLLGDPGRRFNESQFLAEVIKRFNENARNAGITDLKEVTRGILEGRYVPYRDDLEFLFIALKAPGTITREEINRVAPKHIEGMVAMGEMQNVNDPLPEGNDHYYFQVPLRALRNEAWIKKYGSIQDIGVVKTLGFIENNGQLFPKQYEMDAMSIGLRSFRRYYVTEVGDIYGDLGDANIRFEKAVNNLKDAGKKDLASGLEKHVFEFITEISLPDAFRHVTRDPSPFDVNLIYDGMHQQYLYKLLGGEGVASIEEYIAKNQTSLGKFTSDTKIQNDDDFTVNLLSFFMSAYEAEQTKRRNLIAQGRCPDCDGHGNVYSDGSYECPYSWGGHAGCDRCDGDGYIQLSEAGWGKCKKCDKGIPHK